MNPNPSFAVLRYRVKSIYSIFTSKLTGFLLEIIIHTLVQKVNVNSNIHLFGKAVFEGTLTLANTLLIDIIKCIHGILTQKLEAMFLEIITLTLAQKVNLNTNIHLFGKSVLEGTLTLAHSLLVDITSNEYMEL